MLNWLWPKRPATGASAAGPVPQAFDQRDLIAVLRGNPITNAMLELCPEKYERY